MSDAPSWDDLTGDERNALLELARARANGSITRRDALIGGGAVLAGGAIGGGASQAVGTAAADASTSDADGDVGTPSNRVDVFAQAVDTDELNNTIYCETASELESAVSNASAGDEIVIATDVGTVNNPLEPDAASLHIAGYGRDKSIVRKANDAPLIRPAVGDAPRLSLSNFKGIGLGASTGTTSGVVTDDANSTTRLEVENVEMADMGQDGWQLLKGNLSRFDRPAASTCGRDGIHLATDANGDNNALTVTSADVMDCGRHGVASVGGYQHTFVGGYSAGNSGAGWYADTSEVVYVSVGGETNDYTNYDDIYFDANATQGMVFDAHGGITDSSSQNFVLRSASPGGVQEGKLGKRGNLEFLSEDNILFQDSGGSLQRFARLDRGEGSFWLGSTAFPLRIFGLRDVPSATASNLANGEVATDSGNGRLVWKDQTGSAYYVSGTAL